jgi:hypothetical protein
MAGIQRSQMKGGGGKAIAQVLPRRLKVKVISGTFRLSVVIAVVVAAYYCISGYLAALEAEQANRKLWSTLQCGERFLGQDMSKFASPARPEVIDIGKAGCSNSNFFATFDEIREAVARRDPPAEWRGFGEVFPFKLYEALFAALGTFLVVNLAGVLFLGARGLVRWVRAGYG